MMHFYVYIRWIMGLEPEFIADILKILINSSNISFAEFFKGEPTGRRSILTVQPGILPKF